MKTAAIRLIQQSLIDEGFAPGTPDGKLGTNTYAAVRDALNKRQAVLPADWQSWPGTRQSVAYLQCLCTERSIDAGVIDGFWGPQTDYAYDALAQLQKTGEMPPSWRDQEVSPGNPNSWPEQRETTLTAFYGEVGTNQSKLVLPYPHRLSWDQRQIIKAYECNAKVHDSAFRVLTKVFDHYGMERIKELRLDLWGGCLNVRRMRGGSSWSMHSWGIAIDYDPDHNALKWGRDKAAFAKPEYDAWWRFWEEEGWMSLGRMKNYDWMHVQAARL